MKYSAEEFSQAGDQFLGRSYEEMDCQELVERMMAVVGYKRDLGGSNSWFRECMRNGWTGTPEECVKLFGEVPKGAMIFIWEPVSAGTPEKFRNDGIGDLTHIGIKTGRGDGAIHSSSSRKCVCDRNTTKIEPYGGNSSGTLGSVPSALGSVPTGIGSVPTDIRSPVTASHSSTRRPFGWRNTPPKAIFSHFWFEMK